MNEKNLLKRRQFMHDLARYGGLAALGAVPMRVLAGQPVEVAGMRFSAAAGSGRLVLDLDGPVSHHVFRNWTKFRCITAPTCCWTGSTCTRPGCSACRPTWAIRTWSDESAMASATARTCVSFSTPPDRPSRRRFCSARRVARVTV